MLLVCRVCCERYPAHCNLTPTVSIKTDCLLSPRVWPTVYCVFMTVKCGTCYQVLVWGYVRVSDYLLLMCVLFKLTGEALLNGFCGLLNISFIKMSVKMQLLWLRNRLTKTLIFHLPPLSPTHTHFVFIMLWKCWMIHNLPSSLL